MKKENPDILEKSFAAMYGEYYQRIYAFIYRLVGDADEAGDITQDTFVKLYQSIQKGLVLTDPKAWIFRVACNTAYTRLKQKGKHRELLEKHGETALAPGGNPARQTVEEHLVREEDASRVRAAFNELPVEDRLILELFQAGLSYLEMARIMKVRQSTIGKKLFRARQKLARHIKIMRGAAPRPGE